MHADDFSLIVSIHSIVNHDEGHFNAFGRTGRLIGQQYGGILNFQIFIQQSLNQLFTRVQALDSHKNTCRQKRDP